MQHHHHRTTPTALPVLSTLLTGLLLAGCETAPRAGSDTTAQVLDVVSDRHSLREGHPELHAALRAGVGRADLEAGRLVQGECGVPDATQPRGLRWHTLTTLLPAGARPAPGSLVDLRDAQGAWPATGPHPPPRLHGHYLGPAPAAADPQAPVLCQPPGLPAGQWRIKLRGPLPAWAFDFAQPGLQRLAAFSDADFARGRVLRLGCQLKVADGGDWYVPLWIARAPDGLRLKPGDVVRLRAGAEANSKDTGPAAEVLGLQAGVGAPRGNAVVGCR
jgi:hypothetical protein